MLVNKPSQITQIFPPYYKLSNTKRSILSPYKHLSGFPPVLGFKVPWLPSAHVSGSVDPVGVEARVSGYKILQGEFKILLRIQIWLQLLMINTVSPNKYRNSVTIFNLSTSAKLGYIRLMNGEAAFQRTNRR